MHGNQFLVDSTAGLCVMVQPVWFIGLGVISPQLRFINSYGVVCPFQENKNVFIYAMLLNY